MKSANFISAYIGNLEKKKKLLDQRNPQELGWNV